ncbi:hypothetical protein NDU88_000481 [Pleurodeles waltl]|uniref:Uncharacterized protein n=1 Tax=Pleurodeles waltl TaxID=8319 RepID=A0AAV7Q0Z2_PLEWA|nr:hypothetical protein NDU88_000481 [Pleurodeles waltl]
MTRCLTGKKAPNPLVQGNTHLACSRGDKAEVLPDTLEAPFRPNQVSKLVADVEHDVSKHHPEQPPETEAPTFEECSRDEIRALVKKLKNNKAPRKDRITNQAIEMLLNTAVIFFLRSSMGGSRTSASVKPGKKQESWYSRRLGNY